MKKHVLSAVAAAALLLPVVSSAQSTASPVVDITVTVAANGAVSCTPDLATVSAKFTVVSFHLDAPASYSFAARNAIVVAEPAGDFPSESWTLSPTHAGLLDINAGKGTYKYTVNLVDHATGRVISYDPEIQNGGTSPG